MILIKSRGKTRLTDDIIEITSFGNGVGSVLVQRAKVLTEGSVGLDIKRELLSEDCGRG